MGLHAGGRCGGKSTAEEAEAAEHVGLDSDEMTAEQSEFENVEDVAEEDNLSDNRIPNIDGPPEDTEGETSEIEYELKTEANEKCRNYNVIEAIEVNYDGSLFRK